MPFIAYDFLPIYMVVCFSHGISENNSTVRQAESTNCAVQAAHIKKFDKERPYPAKIIRVYKLNYHLVIS